VDLAYWLTKVENLYVPRDKNSSFVSIVDEHERNAKLENKNEENNSK
jgi:hypothetical protein